MQQNPEFDQAQFERHRILKGFGYDVMACIDELAQRAVDTSYNGFEDPRSAAVEGIIRNSSFGIGNACLNGDQVDCSVEDCDASIRFSLLQATYELAGECIRADVCVSDLWDERTSDDDIISKLYDQSLFRGSSDQASFICPHIGCNFSCGFTIEGNDGSHGVCEKKRETRVDLPSHAESTKA